MSRLSTITDDELHNPHAGESLASEFLEPLRLDIKAVAQAIGVSTERLEAVVAGRDPLDADLDLRLGRYLGMSEGFFLRLQDRYALLEAKRALNGELDRIVPRAA